MCLFRYLVHILKVQYGLISIYNIAIEILLFYYYYYYRKRDIARGGLGGRDIDSNNPPVNNSIIFLPQLINHELNVCELFTGDIVNT